MHLNLLIIQLCSTNVGLLLPNCFLEQRSLVMEAVCSVKTHCDSFLLPAAEGLLSFCDAANCWPQQHLLLRSSSGGVNTDLTIFSANFLGGDKSQGALHKHIQCFSVDTYRETSSCFALVQSLHDMNQLKGKGENKGTEIWTSLTVSPLPPCHCLQQQQQLWEVSRRLSRPWSHQYSPLCRTRLLALLSSALMCQSRGYRRLPSSSSLSLSLQGPLTVRRKQWNKKQQQQTQKKRKKKKEKKNCLFCVSNLIHL